jgi:hypothetical protein
MGRLLFEYGQPEFEPQEGHRHVVQPPASPFPGEIVQKSGSPTIDGFLARARLAAKLHQASFLVDLHLRLDIQQAADETGGVPDPTPPL